MNLIIGRGAKINMFGIRNDVKCVVKQLPVLQKTHLVIHITLGRATPSRAGCEKGLVNPRLLQGKLKVFGGYATARIITHISRPIGCMSTNADKYK